MISKSVEMQTERPDLAGLPLLRAAMMVLPPERRRKVVAMSQADWFEPGLAVAYRLHLVERTRDIPTMSQQVELADALSERVAEHTELLREIAGAAKVTADAQGGSWRSGG